jgi:hypothetical protein
MKKGFFISCYIFFSTCLLAQNLTLTHSKIPVADVTADVWSANLNDNMSFYEKTFEDFTKKEFGIRSRSDGKNEEFLEKVSIPQVTDKRGDLRLTFYTEGDRNKLGLSLLLGYDVWINPDDYPAEMGRLKQFAKDYLRFHYTEYYNEIIDQDLKLIASYKKSIEKSEKSIGTMRSQISKNEDKLESETNSNRRNSLEKKNQENTADIERLEAEIPELQGKIDSLDEHVLQTKEKLKFVDEQYYEASDSAQN